MSKENFNNKEQFNREPEVQRLFEEGMPESVGGQAIPSSLDDLSVADSGKINPEWNSGNAAGEMEEDETDEMMGARENQIKSEAHSHIKGGE